MSDAREDSGPSTEREGTTLARSFLLSLLGPPLVLVLVLTPGFIGILREPPSGMDGMTFGGVLFLYALFAAAIIIPVSVIGVPLAAVATWQTLRHRTWRRPPLCPSCPSSHTAAVLSIRQVTSNCCYESCR